MDGATLQSIMQSPNWSLWGPATDAFTTGQEQAKATLADTLQKTQQAAEMHPLNLAAKKAETDLSTATARNTNATAATSEDALKVLQQVPMDQRVAAKMGEMLTKVAEGDKAKIGADMLKASKWAAQAIQQGGQLSVPQMLQLSEESPDLVNYFKQPGGARTVANMVTAFNALDAERQKSDSAHRIGAGATIRAAEIARDSHLQGIDKQIAGGIYSKNHPSYLLQKALYGGNFEQAAVAARQAAIEAAQRGDQEDAQMYQALSADYAQKAMDKAAAAAREGNMAKPDLNPMGIQTVRPTPGAGVQAPKVPQPPKPAVSDRVTIYKDGKPIGTIPKHQVEEAQKQGYTIK